MRCPACKERIIGFIAWSQGAAAFRKRDCPHCGSHLQVSRRTVAGFVLLSLLSIPLVVGIAESLNAFGVPEPIAHVIFGCLMIPLVGIVAYFAWRTGYYSVQDDPQQGVASDRLSTVTTSGPGELRLLFVAAIAVGLIVYMIASGRRDLLLTFDKQMSEGRITGIRSVPPDAIRISDYQITYEFETNLGLVYSGEDVLPPKYPPPEDGRILIAYSRRDPSVSRIASQLTDTPLTGILLGTGFLLWSVAQFTRQRRRSASLNERNNWWNESQIERDGPG